MLPVSSYQNRIFVNLNIEIKLFDTDGVYNESEGINSSFESLSFGDFRAVVYGNSFDIEIQFKKFEI